MKHFKINVGRKDLSSEYIQSKQNFNSVLTGARLSKNKIWQTSWFYGVIGLAGVASVVGYNFYQSQEHITNETIITQNNNITEKEIEQGVVSLAVNTSDTQFSRGSATMGYVEIKMDEPEKGRGTHFVKAVSVEEPTVNESAHQFVDTPPVEIEKKAASKLIRNSMPSIAGVYNGDISWESFKDGVIFVGEDLSVKQFSIQYTTRIGDKTISVEGDKIPNEVALELENLGLNQTVFITNVVCKNQDGELMRFVSMDLNLKFK